MSEKPEELDLEKISVYEYEDLKRAIKHSFNDYDGEICYMNGKTLKIKDFIDFTTLAHRIQTQLQVDYIREVTCSLKRKPTTS